MFKIQFSANSFSELRDQLIERANEIGCNDIVSCDKPQTGFDPNPERPMVVPKDGAAYKASIEPTGTAGEVDSQGLPWDERIHASSKSLSKDGSWRTRRMVDPQVVQQVEAELRNFKHEVPAPVTVPFQVPTDEAPFQHPIFGQTAKTQPTPVAFIPPAQPQYEEIQVPQGPVRPAYDFQSFKTNFLGLINELVKAGTIDQNYIQELCKHFQIQAIWNVLGSEKICMDLYRHFAGLGYITAVD